MARHRRPWIKSWLGLPIIFFHRPLNRFPFCWDVVCSPSTVFLSKMARWLEPDDKCRPRVCCESFIVVSMGVCGHVLTSFEGNHGKLRQLQKNLSYYVICINNIFVLTKSSEWPYTYVLMMIANREFRRLLMRHEIIFP